MRIGSYQVLLELARGGMGKVFLARSVGPSGIERLVAIKRAHEHLLVESRAVADRFLDEARVASHVHHSNVIGMHQAGADGEGYYLVLDYVEGESLQGLIDLAGARGGRVPPQIVLAVVCDALAGLHAAHEAADGHGRALGILHRDVSTDNLLVGRDGVTRLTDFGIAKSALSIAVTEERYVQGKLVYMAPEYLRRKPVDRTVDIYGMGMTLWIALSDGKGPWPGAEEPQLLECILVQGVPPLPADRGSTEITAVLSRACDGDPHARFRTARAMLDALEEAKQSIGGLARHVEVSEFVEGLVGPELAARRNLLNAKRLELEAEEPRTAQNAALPAAVAEARGPKAVPRRSWEGPGPWRALVYATAIALVVAIAVMAFRRTPGHAIETPAPPTARERAPAQAAPLPSPEMAPPAPPVATEPEPSPPAASAPPSAHPRTHKQAGKTTTLPFSTTNPYK